MLNAGSIIGVIGAGTMGRGIAQIAASNGHKTLVFDASGEARAQARTSLEKVMARLVDKARVQRDDADAILARIEFVDGFDALAPCDMVIEAVFEDLAVKRELFSALEAIVSADTVLATNTSSLSVAAISSVCKEARRVIGVHFFNPAPLMALVEIIPGVMTAADVVTATRSLVDAWGKVTVLAKDTPGFIVNRVARPFYGEALRILDEGIADVATIDRAMKVRGGFRMGPFELMDFIGNDVNYAVTESTFAAFFGDPRYKPSFTQKRRVEAGLLGRKSGRGFYEYGEAASAPVADENDALGEQVFSRILAMLINEAADALFWGVASRDDIDLAMTKGVNYPKGLLRWADDVGVVTVVAAIDGLRERYREDRYRTSPLLADMAAAKRKFYD